MEGKRNSQLSVAKSGRGDHTLPLLVDGYTFKGSYDVCMLTLRGRVSGPSLEVFDEVRGGGGIGA